MGRPAALGTSIERILEDRLTAPGLDAARPQDEDASLFVERAGEFERHVALRRPIRLAPATRIEAPELVVGPSRVQSVVKRSLDILVSAIALLALLPLMAVVALAIVLESPGPVFYRAKRVGRGGRLMKMLKFRKMREGASGVMLTTGDDARLTRVGVFLTRSKLDEIPQLINVLKGDMSLIGPRPEDPGFVIARQTDYDEILRARPGITGLSQIAFAAESRILSTSDPVGHYLSTIFPQKCALDRMYVRHADLRTDFRILAWTTVAVVMRREVAVHRETGALGLRRRPRPVPEPSDRRATEHGVRVDLPRLREHEPDGLAPEDRHSLHAPRLSRHRRLMQRFRRRPR
jgi:lipopolysaccharide/colanic/teichoic acid biosynthesis glycosyltransferase